MSFAVHPEQHAPGEPAVAPGPAAPAAPPVSGAETVPAEHWWAPIERTLAGRLLASVADLPLSIVLPNGQEVGGSTRPPIARLRVADHAPLLGLLGPDSELCFGDAYADGRLVVEGDLLELLVAAIRSPGDGWAARAGSWWRWIRRRGNSLTRARANARHHYDLGNDFYRLWLDREMVYTCAYFPTPTAILDDAQVAKMEHVARKLRLRPGEHRNDGDEAIERREGS